MSDSRGTPLEGDRGAFDTVDHADKHALDIQNDALLRHLPAPSAAGTYARDDGTNWQSQLGIILADLLGYARGAIIRGGVAAWEALSLGAANTVLKSDGMDAAWGNVAHSELTGVTTDDHHARYTDAEAEAVADTQIGIHATDADAHHTAFTSADIATLAKLNAILTDATLDDAGDSRTDNDAIHDNVAGEIHAIAEKATPVDADEIVIEDSADAWAKKRVALSNLPSASGGGDIELLFGQVVDVTVVNTTTATSVLGAGRGSKTIPANTLDVGTVIRVTLSGHLSDSGAPTLDLAIELGGTEVCSTGAQTLNNTVSEVDWHATILITCRETGATGKVVTSGLFEHDDDAQFGLVKTGTTSVDTTSAILVDALVTWGTADAGNTVTCQQAMIELIKSDNLAVAAPSGLTATEV